MRLQTLTIDGTDFVAMDAVLLPETEIVQDMGGRVATARFVLTQGAFGAIVGRAIVGESVVGFAAPTPQSEVIAQNESTETIFAGYLSKLSQNVQNGVHRYELDCVDYTILLDTVMIESEAYASMTDEAIIDDLFATYMPSVDTSEVETVETLDSIELTDISLREALERLRDRTGAEFYLDFDMKLQYYAAGSKVAPFAIDEQDPAYYPLEDSLKYEEDFSNPANRVRVVGIGATVENTVVQFQPSASGDDGWTNRVDTAYPPVFGAPNTNTADAEASCGNSFGFGIYVLGVALLRFDTSTIPDGADVLSATLKLWPNSLSFANGGELSGEYYDPANWPISDGDWTPTVNESAFVGRPIFGFSTGQYNDISLSTPAASISKTGYTGLRLHAKVTGTPTGNNIFAFQSFDGANKPILEVTYQVSTAGAEATENDTASQAIYGVLERTIIDRQILTDEEASLRAQVELATYAIPRVSGSLKVRNDGLSIGQLVSIALPSIGVDDDFTIRRLAMRWITQTLTEYTVDFGDFRPDLITLVRKMARKQ